MALIIIRLLPEEPVAAADFETYLNGLSIELREMSLADPAGDGAPIGTLDYLPPNLPASPSPDATPQPDGNTDITQHFVIEPDPIQPILENRVMHSVATAVLEIPAAAAGTEYRTRDLLVIVRRGGNEILGRRRFYNVPMTNAGLPGDPNDFVGLNPISLHIHLPAPGQVSGPAVAVPEDGGAPRFADLRTAVEDVLNSEPGNLNGIADLSLADARHVAREITWDRDAFPMPLPDRSLEQIYTGPHSASSDEERDRQMFESDLTIYYIAHDSEADQLTNFVFALSAALWCAERSENAEVVGFAFPVIPDQTDVFGLVHLDRPGPGPIDPDFGVLAEYFYALTALLPPQIARQQRYDIATLQSEGQAIAAITQAIEDNAIEEPAAMSRFQASRRLAALGRATEANVPLCPLQIGSDAHGLITDWLAVAGESTEAFWAGLNAQQAHGHLELALCAISDAHDPLIAAVQAPAFGVDEVGDLANRTDQDWTLLFSGDPSLLPPFTAPGTLEERIAAFLRNLRRFFQISAIVDPFVPEGPDSLPGIPRAPGNPVDALINAVPGFDFSNVDQVAVTAALPGIFPGDTDMQAQFLEWLLCMQGAFGLTAGIEGTHSPEIRFSVTEALWARGFLNAGDLEDMSLDDFRDALRGTVAFDHAATIFGNAQAGGATPIPPVGSFTPINPDGSLTNCLPPKHLSPLGPVGYLKDLLRLTTEATCHQPFPDTDRTPISGALAARRARLDELLASTSNLCTAIPLVDIINESLEHMVATATPVGTFRNTGSKTLAEHDLDTAAEPEPDAHDAETLFCALPEHSTPATPTAEPDAWDVLRNDFTACNLPYNQPLDVNRSYLSAMATSRWETMRHFRRDITEYVLDPAAEPNEFRAHLWRLPVRQEIAVEYLGISSEEEAVLYTSGGVGNATLPLHYGYPQGRDDWIDDVRHLPVFLERTCLSYCEFLDLMASGFVSFTVSHRRERQLPECEPCCLDEFVIVFENPNDPLVALKHLNAFIRLWRLLNSAGHEISFQQLADIAEVLTMFNGSTVNSDFLHQLASVLMLIENFDLPLVDGDPMLGSASGAERLHLLSFWASGSTRFEWAIEQLLFAIQQYAMDEWHCDCRPPEFLRLLRENLNPLSRLAGFDPDTPAETWFAQPTHTLRFAEVLAKIYASDFTVGEILFLFTVEPQLQGDEPFPAQTENEARDFPFGLPDDEDPDSLYALRRALMTTEPGDGGDLTWSAMGDIMHQRFNMPLPPDSDRWPELGRKFFPRVIEAEGTSVAAADRSYDVALAANATSANMWNTGGGPFSYDAAAGMLSVSVGFSDDEVLTKLARIRGLSPVERDAVIALYHAPRTDLAFFSFLFENPVEADARLIQEPDEAARWAYFQAAIAAHMTRADVIDDHLATLSARVTGFDKEDGKATSGLLLRQLWATENFGQTSWENDSGAAPNVTWEPQPRGGAYHALSRVTGTGLLAEYRGGNGLLRWREVRGGLDAFGAPENAVNAPLPTMIPSMSTTLSPELLQFVAIRNGFAIGNEDGALIGGAEPYTLRWSGLVLIETSGNYGFAAGAPTDGVELPDFEALRRTHRWRVRLQRGQKSGVLLAHDWPDEEAPADCAAPIRLDRGFYDIVIELERLALDFDGPEDLCSQITGFQLKYDGPDSGDCWSAIPNDKLFIGHKDDPLTEGFDTALIASGTGTTLAERYYVTVRDMRSTFQRASKAMLFAYRMNLSTHPVADDGQSELAYMLSQPEAFEGQSHYQDAGVQTHRVHFDFNLLPWSDNYHPPDPADDRRIAPSPQRMQAWFDIWERFHDYTVMRRETGRSPEQPVWLLFHEAEEMHIDNPTQLLRHMGADLRHDLLIRRYYEGPPGQFFEVDADNLIDDRWAIRVWRADLWVQALRHEFHPRRIRAAEPYLWASDGPELAGLENLTKFYRDGCIENGDPLRYSEIEALNNGLRGRGRSAMIAWLTRLDRMPLPWGGFAEHPRDLSELLLFDVEAGLCQKITRIEEVIEAMQLLVNRHRLGLEGDGLSVDFLAAWESRLVDYRTWQNCRRREIYRENWIDWDRQETARRSEAFAFFEDELRRKDLTLPRPGGLVHWSGGELPSHKGLTLFQNREPATMTSLQPERQGLGLLAWPDRAARPSWLAPLGVSATPPFGNDDDVEPEPDQPDNDDIILLSLDAAGIPANAALGLGDDIPMWFKAAIDLGTTFLRIAAAATPAASGGYEPLCDAPDGSPCCTTCGKAHPPMIDEYYFWIEMSESFSPVEQVAEWGSVPDNVETGEIGDPKSDWHRPEELPGLLRWRPKRTAHLHWCRVHNGEFQPRRKSVEGVEIRGNEVPDLVFLGRLGDSLNFEITAGVPRVGHPTDPNVAFPPPGFRYDIRPDDAVLLPEVVTAEVPEPVGAMPAFPFFAFHHPGAPILPRSRFALSTAVATRLATDCKYDDALGYLALLWNPLEGDNRWVDCDPERPDLPDLPNPDGSSVPIPAVLPPRRGSRPRRCCCPSEPASDVIAERRHLTMRFVETLVDWGDAYLRKNTPAAFGQARQFFETAERILGDTPVTTIDEDAPDPDQTVLQVDLACAPLNPRLMCLYTRTNDRLGLVRSCQNAMRLKSGRPFFEHDRVRECWKLDGEVCLDDTFWCTTPSPYRFEVLVARAKELAREVSSLGNQLLAAYEKGDAEHLQALRARHERQINDLILSIRKDQWRDADWQTQALEKTKAIALTNLTYYRNLIQAGLLTGESQYEPLTITSTTLRTAGNVVEAIGQAMNLIPDPNVGFPTNFITLPPGKKLAMIFAASGTITRTAADVVNTVAGLGLTKDGWDRREDEWEHMVDTYSLEVEKVERERLAALRRRDVALRELNNHRQTMENAAEVQDFLRDKYTGQALYLWLQAETAGLHHRLYELALQCAWQAQRAFNLERGHTSERFIADDTWDNLHEGLLSGERLGLALNQMEKAYADRNKREYEITKHIALREIFPVAFLELQTTGACEFTVPEWLFDLDYPGHYMRRIKSLALSLPSVTGPYTSINCRMTVQSSETRVSPKLTEPVHRCCDETGCNNGYPPLSEDSRIVHSRGATESVVTSEGTDDHGLFQFRLDDPRYLPFEYQGAACRIRLELHPDENQFNLDTLRDVVLHMRYTAREGGDMLKAAARECAQSRLPNEGTRLIDAIRETGDQWRPFESKHDTEETLLGVPLLRHMLPFLTGRLTPVAESLEVLIEAPEARPSTQLELIFYEGQALSGLDPDTCKEGVHTVVAVGDAAWPGFYHGVIQFDEEHPLMGEAPTNLGVLRIPLPKDVLGNVYLLHRYSTTTDGVS